MDFSIQEDLILHPVLHSQWWPPRKARRRPSPLHCNPIMLMTPARVRGWERNALNLSAVWLSAWPIELDSYTGRIFPSAVIHLSRMHSYRFMIVPVVLSSSGCCPGHFMPTQWHWTRSFLPVHSPIIEETKPTLHGSLHYPSNHPTNPFSHSKTFSYPLSFSSPPFITIFPEYLFSIPILPNFYTNINPSPTYPSPCSPLSLHCHPYPLSPLLAIWHAPSPPLTSYYFSFPILP